MSTLKPCPFCGYVGLSFDEGSTFRWMLASCQGCGATCGEVRVQTAGEGKPSVWRERAIQHAIEAWNTRAALVVEQPSQVQIQAGIQELRAVEYRGKSWSETIRGIYMAMRRAA